MKFGRSRRWKPSRSCSRRWPRTWPRNSGKSSATTETLAYAPWPEFDPALLKDDEVEVPVQVNGKLRSADHRPRGRRSRAAIEAAAGPTRRSRLPCSTDKTVKKVVIVPGKLVNFVVG